MEGFVEYIIASVEEVEAEIERDIFNAIKGYEIWEE
jgi:hypothetical protein